MNIDFATCNKHTAFEYIQRVYPKKEIKEEQVSKLLSLVDRDIVRIQDPMMYGMRIGVVAGNNHTPLDDHEIQDAIAQLKENNIIS